MLASLKSALVPLLLSVDFEDWHQLVRRRVGAANWREPGPALGRQTAAVLELFDELGVRCTFFVLGMAARSHPGLVREIADRGHEIACHGDAHLPVFGQTRDEFAGDVRAACRTIEELTGVRPVGYRAPAFSVNRDTLWWPEVLAEQGFVYDSSVSDASFDQHPHTLVDGRLWEFPIAGWRAGRLRLPVGGASYWSVMPDAVLVRALDQAGSHPALYLHPNELDPEGLRAQLAPGVSFAGRSQAALRTGQRNLARRRAPGVLRAIAERFELITYGQAHAQLSDGDAASS
jgi:polysaccharide deacetylase family protein (PEP-CTERM system associated)